MKTNEIFKSKKIMLLIAVAIMNVLCCGVGFAQTTTFQPYTDSVAHAVGVWSGAYFGNFLAKINDYNGNLLGYIPISYSGLDIQNATMRIGININKPTNVHYALYAVKPNDNRVLQQARECECNKSFTTIDSSLIKIYDFNNGNAINETVSGYRTFDWDGYTSDGGHIRDCVYVGATDDAGNVLGSIVPAKNPVEGYRMGFDPGVEFTKDDQNVYHAKITMAYDKPVTKISTLIVTENCDWDAITFGIANKGADAMVADVNRRSMSVARNPHKVIVAYKTFTPTDKDVWVDPAKFNNSTGVVKIFKWDNITDIDGNKLTYPIKDNPYDPGFQKYYMLAVILETDIPTISGLKDGYLFYGDYHDMSVVGEYTDIPKIPVADGKIIIETTPDGFIINAKGNFAGEWALTSAAGEKVSSGKGSFVSKNGLPKGVYLLTVSNAQGGNETQKVIVR